MPDNPHMMLLETLVSLADRESGRRAITKVLDHFHFYYDLFVRGDGRLQIC